MRSGSPIRYYGEPLYTERFNLELGEIELPYDWSHPGSGTQQARDDGKVTVGFVSGLQLHDKRRDRWLTVQHLEVDPHSGEETIVFATEDGEEEWPPGWLVQAIRTTDLVPESAADTG